MAASSIWRGVTAGGRPRPRFSSLGTQYEYQIRGERVRELGSLAPESNTEVRYLPGTTSEVAMVLPA